jgi:hypothetical protein
VRLPGEHARALVLELAVGVLEPDVADALDGGTSADAESLEEGVVIDSD